MTTLFLSNRGLTEIPNDLSNAVEYLYLDDNRITELKNLPHNLKYLER